MTKDNVIICSNCNTENPLFVKNCKNCKHYLRAAIVNIDLWKTIWGVFENPKDTLKNVIFAEHKNFILFLLIFLSAKLFIYSAIFQSGFNLLLPHTDYFIYNLLIQLAIYSVSIILFIKIFTISIRKRIQSRFKDNLAVFIYSFIPIILSLFILSPVEYGIFGKHWFIYNPSPFLIKETLAYILSGIEILLFIWSLIILFIAFKLQTNSKILGIIFIVLFLTIITSEIILIPFTLL